MKALGKERWDKLFTFSFARDPLECVLSTFRYRKYKLYPPNENIIPDNVTFRQWVHDFVKELPDRYQVELGGRSRFWTDSSGNCLVDKIYDFADLEKSWVDICSKIGIISELPDINGTGRQSVEKHYTPEMKRIVMTRFEEEAEILAKHDITWK